MSYSIEWLELLTRVMGDYIPSRSFDAIYLVGETKGNAPSVWERGAELYGQRQIPIAIQQGGAGYGYVGFEPSFEALRKLGVPENFILPMPILREFEESKNVNTLTEFISLAQMGKERQWHRIILVAPHFHQLRVFFTAVTVGRECPRLEFYNCVGMPLPWQKEVIHSQGTSVGTRLEFIKAEIERIQRYQKDGKPYPLVSLERAIEYLDQRDEGYGMKTKPRDW